MKFLRYLVLVLFNPFWYLQRLFPRDNNIWVFGAWFGRKFSDNPKSLFEYVKDKDDEIRVIWLTKNKLVVKELVNNGIECYLVWSIKGIWYSFRAGKVIYSSGKLDINSFFINGAKTFQLWHGAPMKKIGLDDKLIYRSWVDIIKKYLLPFLYEYNVNYVVSTSEIFDAKLCSAFNVNQSQIIKSGYPRNDIFYNDKKIHPLVKKWNSDYSVPLKILYLPTFRNHGESTNLLANFNFDALRIDEFLTNINGLLIMKGHYADNGFTQNELTNRIVTIEDQDVPEINPILKDIDILLTDYSGAYFDFLLTEKPLIFTPFDFNEYVTQNRELYFNYQDIIGGPIATDWISVEKNIKEVLKLDNYAILRKKMKMKFNSYNDGESSKKLYKIIKEI